jgi:hypothetical protein
MNLKDRQQKLNKAKKFIEGVKPAEKPESQKKESSPRAKKKDREDKGYLTIYLPKELKKKVALEAIRTTDSGLKSHFVEMVLEQYFKDKESKEDES